MKLKCIAGLDALPVGNGRLGAMIFGNPAIDRVQLNEESIWGGELRDRNNPRAGEAMPKIRELLFAGRIAEAEALATTDMLSIPRRMPCYQTLGDLRLDFSASGLTPETKVEDYRLELNLDTAIATTRFRCAGTSYVREVFSSAPDQVIVVRMTAEGPGRIGFAARMDRPAHFTTSANGSDRLVLAGEAAGVARRLREPGAGSSAHFAPVGAVSGRSDYAARDAGAGEGCADDAG